MKRAISSLKRCLWLAALLPVAACSADAAPEAENEDALTSILARSRELEFEGLVYADRGASDAAILKLVRRQSQTAFGALLNHEIAVESREVRDVDPATFKKRDVEIVDTDDPESSPKKKVEVRYTYLDKAVIPVKLSRRTSLPTALIAGDYAEQARLSRIVTECTKNDHEARSDAADGLTWYNFNPNKASCKKAITDEQKRIEADRGKLADKRTQVTLSQMNRFYLPLTVRLTTAETARGATYPEYQKLFAGGVEPGKLVIGLVAGRLSHDRVDAIDDDGYFHWMDSLGVLFEAHPKFALKKIEPAEDISAVTVAGRRITGLTFNDFIQWTVYDRGYPEGLNAAGKKELREKIAKKLDNHWVTFEMPVKLTIGNEPSKDLTIVLNTLFGAEDDPTPHKRAIKKSDIFIYNGHSYIGYGPLDPANFRPSDFPRSYQLFFIDGCVSYNYYNEGYFLLKAGGTKTLDTITNGLEAPEWDSGAAEGRLLARLIDGSSASYRTLLTAAKSTDAMRVVDGEADNEYVPANTPIRVEAR